MTPSSGTTTGPTYEVDADAVAWIRFDDPDRSVNVLTETVMQNLAGVLATLREDIAAEGVRGVVLWSAKERGFIAGADVEAIRGVEDPQSGAEAARLGQAIFRQVEQLPVPTLAAIHGACMGGGLELALACRYRVASDAPSTRMALPEVQLGILPAWGGTTRLPRLVGLQAALDMILTGRPVAPRKAHRMGLVEAVIPAALFREGVKAFMTARLGDGDIPTGARRGLARRLLEDTAPGRRLVLHQARKGVLEKTGGHYPAPLRILEVISRSLGQPLDRALEEEAKAAGELIASRVSKELLHIYFLREGARKGADVPGLAKVPKVEKVGIVGAGVMGGGIAHLAASHGIQVRIMDLRHEAVSGALAHARELFRKGVERGKVERREADRMMDLISGGLDHAGFGETDLVVEAVVEKLEVKRKVLSELEKHVGSGTILATNTSTLSVAEMGEALERPEDFLGMHFFNPVHRMPLVEVVRGPRTNDAAVALVYALSLRLGKVPVIVNDGPGFLVNRVLGPYLNEAGHLLAEGVSVERIDGAAVAFGMPMGPLRLMDEVGIDVASHAGAVLHQAFGARLEPARPLVALGSSGRTGRKGGLGFYRYEGGKQQAVDPGLAGILGDAVAPASAPMEEPRIRARLILAMINEAARALEEGIVESAGDADLAMVMGTGFPPFKGGLLRLADELHARTVVGRLRELEEEVGPRFAPAGILVELAAEDRGFYDAFPGGAARPSSQATAREVPSG